MNQVFKHTLTYTKLLILSLLILILNPLTLMANNEPESTDDYITPPPEIFTFTPDGNLTLVDDFNPPEALDHQFITITTKGGHIFYIIIDRTGQTQNVHFLNQVDASDLLALLEDDFDAEAIKPAMVPTEPIQTAPDAANDSRHPPGSSPKDSSPPITIAPSTPKTNPVPLVVLGLTLIIGIVLTCLKLKGFKKKAYPDPQDDPYHYNYGDPDEDYADDDSDAISDDIF